MSVESVELLRQENKEKILQTVKNLLNENNPSEISLGEIAKQAGVSVRTINNIFGTKNSLLLMTAISAYMEEHTILDQLIASSEFIEKTGLEQVMALHYERAKRHKKYPYIARVVSEIEHSRFLNEAEIKQCNQYLMIVDTISSYYDAPIQKGHMDGSIKINIKSDEIKSILFFSFGAIIQRLQTINLNELMSKQVDSYGILRTVLKITKEYIGSYQ